MTKYLNRISFSIDYYDKENHDELVENYKKFNGVNNRDAFIQFYKKNPDSIRVKHDYIKNRMSGMAHFVGECFLESLPKFEIKNTSLLNFYIYNNLEKQESYSLGDSLNYCGMISRFFDWDKFLKQDDSSKRQSILDLVYNSMINYAKEFSLDINSINAAFTKTQTMLSGFIIVNKHLYFKRNRFKLYKAYRYNFENVEYGIVYENLETAEKELFPICAKKHFYGVEKPWMTINDLLLTPMQLKYDGYNNELDIYEMSYGSEKYIFDIKTKNSS